MKYVRYLYTIKGPFNIHIPAFASRSIHNTDKMVPDTYLLWIWPDQVAECPFVRYLLVPVNQADLVQGPNQGEGGHPVRLGQRVIIPRGAKHFRLLGQIFYNLQNHPSHFPLRGKVGQLSKKRWVLCWSIYIISLWVRQTMESREKSRHNTIGI